MLLYGTINEKTSAIRGPRLSIFFVPRDPRFERIISDAEVNRFSYCNCNTESKPIDAEKCNEMKLNGVVQKLYGNSILSIFSFRFLDFN